ncbi:MAG: division/cell wall cluster transcriptional repressor MraZ [Rhodothermales bacterium]|nr:division/cell wall cluster transcriptional repressor MraZ [Rhodothermales bacterium]
MAGFKGQADNSIDGKGRVAIPAKMRRALNPEAKETFTITRGPERCVFLYPLDRWEEMEEELAQLNPFQREARHFMRTLLRWADEVSLDKQGRVTLSKPLMEFAGLTDRALVIGALDHIEIWDPEVFDAYLNESPGDYETVAERVMGGL